MNILATHHNPHLDDICGLWLLRRFIPRFKKAKIIFISQGGKYLAPHIVGVGVGRGVYDEHKGDIYESATTLVYNEVKKYVKNKDEKRALQQLTSFVCAEDHAQFMGMPGHEFSIASALLAMSKVPYRTHNDTQMFAFGVVALEGLLTSLMHTQRLIRDSKKAIFFETKWGKGIALKTEAPSACVGEHAAQHGCAVFVVINTKTGYRYIKATPKATEVDFAEQFAEVRRRETHADWYFHHSHRMLICGSDVSKTKQLSKLTLKELVAVVTL